jgi:hypothetical protein
VYTRIMPDGKKITKDGHAACFEYLLGKKIEFPKPRFGEPIVMHPAAVQWVGDRELAGVEHKRLGTFGNSGSRLTRLAPGAKIPARIEADAEIRYLIAGSITYGGKTWQGGETADVGTYMWVQAGAEVGEITSPEGGTFFVIELQMLADIAAAQAREKSKEREPQLA